MKKWLIITVIILLCSSMIYIFRNDIFSSKEKDNNKAEVIDDGKREDKTDTTNKKDNNNDDISKEDDNQTNEENKSDVDNNNNSVIDKTDITNSNTNNTNSNTGNNSEADTPKVEEPLPVVKTTREKNNDIINDIQAIYGFGIKNGDGTYCYYQSVACTALYDDEKANNTLNNLLVILKNFPTNFFRMFQGENGYRIELMDDIPYNTAGLASYEIPGDNVMYLNVNVSFEDRVFYHETWHLVEQLILYKNNFNDVFSSNWSNYNPDGFVYGSTSDKIYTIYDYDNKNMSSFISTYAKNNVREDRAEVFADLMFRGIKQWYMTGTNVNEKAKFLAQQIRNIWGTNNYYWERLITW